MRRNDETRHGYEMMDMDIDLEVCGEELCGWDEADKATKRDWD